MRILALGIAMLCPPAFQGDITGRVIVPAAPIYIRPDATVPLRTAAEGTVFAVVGEEGEWLRVEFEDPQFGRRTGYVLAKFVTIERPELAPMDLSVRPPAPAVDGSTPAPSPSADTGRAPVPTSATVGGLESLGGRLKPNTRLLVYDDLQNRREIRFRDLTGGTLYGEERQGRSYRRSPVAIPGTQIARIQELRSDPIGRGLGIGAAVGGGLALIGAAGCVEIYGHDGTDCAMAALLVYALPGVAIGGLIDWAIKEPVTIYQASQRGAAMSWGIAPVIARGGAGASVLVRF